MVETDIPRTTVPPLTTMFFYPDGQVHKVTLPRDTKVHAVWVTGQKEIEYFQNGTLKKFTLAKTQRIGSYEYQKGLTILLDAQGQVVDATL